MQKYLSQLTSGDLFTDYLGINGGDVLNNAKAALVNGLSQTLDVPNDPPVTLPPRVPNTQTQPEKVAPVNTDGEDTTNSPTGPLPGISPWANPMVIGIVAFLVVLMIILVARR
jgi:hypothetical protein